VGGTDFSTICEDRPPTGPGGNDSFCGLSRAYWFDPVTATWSDTPTDMPAQVWYPGAITYPVADRFRPIVLGGGPVQGPGCGLSTSGLPFQYQEWWTLPVSYSSGWTTYYDSYLWHEYDRAFLLEDGNIITVGHEIVCEQGLDNLPSSAHPYGDNPVQKLTITPTSQQHDPGPDPNFQTSPSPPFPLAVGGWNYSNAVILHTLKNKTLWDPSSTWSNNYDLDRIIVTGGTYEREDASGSQSQPAMFHTLELKNAPNGPWVKKSSPDYNRVFAGSVPLPDGTILAVGGQDNLTVPPSITTAPVYQDAVQRFDPQGPNAPGVWKTMATRTPVVTDPVLGPLAVARGYHHVALLIKDGTVALMGGEPFGNPPYWNSNQPELFDSPDTVEIFQPPYHFKTQRLRFLSPPTQEMHYGEPYALSVNDPDKASYACLLGIAAVTHHFDYGARYVELMAQHPTGGGLNVLPPPGPSMAPEGYYMLFVVELRLDGNQLIPIPSKGEFVKLKLP